MRWLIACSVVLVLTVCCVGLARAELTAYWSFNDGTGNTLSDNSGRGNDGTLQGTTLPSWVDGHGSAANDKSLYFSGIGSASTGPHVLLGDKPDLEPIGNRTISMWINPDRLDARMDPYGKAYGGSGTLVQWDGGLVYFFNGETGNNSGTYRSSTPGAYDNINSGTSLTANTWQHVAMVRDLEGGISRFYIDGVETSTKSAFFDPPGGARPLVSGSLNAYIGRGYHGSNYEGYIDDTSMWDEALSPFQIKLLASGAVSPLQMVGGRADWLPGWLFRQEITISSTGSELADFPALVKLTDGANELFAQANSVEGYDILFTTADGRTLLPHNLENFSTSSGSEDLTAWVKTSLSATEDTTIYMYYKGPDLGDLSSTDTWNDNYKLVQHLREDPSGAAPQLMDSTANENHGTVGGGISHVDSAAYPPVDGAVAFDNNSRISIANDSSLNATDYTIEMWVKTESETDSYPTLLNRDGQLSTDGYFWIYARKASPELLEFQYANGNIRVETFSGALAEDEWRHVVFTFDDSTKLLSLYIDGTLFGTPRTLTGALPVDDGTLFLGAYAGSITNDTYGFEGLLDEFRFSSAAYDAPWIAATYQFMTSPEALLAFGDPEPIPEPSTFILAAAGLSGLAFFGRRRRRTRN